MSFRKLVIGLLQGRLRRHHVASTLRIARGATLRYRFIRKLAPFDVLEDRVLEQD